MILLSPLEKLINHYLASDVTTREQLKTFDKKTIAIDIDAVSTLYISILENHVILSTNPETQADARIKGTPVNLLTLILDKKNKHIPKTIKIEGDFHIAQALYELSKNIEIDWANYLSQFTGDIGANHLEKFIGASVRAGKELKKSLELNAADYIQHEKKIVPTREALEKFYKAVDDLHLRTERLAAALQQYQKQTNTDPL